MSRQFAVLVPRKCAEMQDKPNTIVRHSFKSLLFLPRHHELGRPQQSPLDL
jgi:hypothetical protein